MNKAKVYFTNLRTTPNSNLLDKMERLVRKAGIADISFEQQFTAIKIHFGEPGNLAYIRPNYAARLVQVLRSLGAKPFLTIFSPDFYFPVLRPFKSVGNDYLALSGNRIETVFHSTLQMVYGVGPASGIKRVTICQERFGT